VGPPSLLNPPIRPAAAPGPERKSWCDGLKEAFKAVARAVAFLLVVPLWVVFRMQAALIGRDQALEYASEVLALLPGLSGRYLRRAFLAYVLEHCHPTATVGFGTLFSKAGAHIGAYVYIGPRCHLGLVHIERDVLIAAGTHITSGARSHGTSDPTRPIREQEGEPRLVRVGAGAWIGSGAVIMADVGRDTIVGAGAVVTKALPDRVIAAGVPARVIRRRDEVGSTQQTEQ
jgi:acetyltransferase-like isoleucine patch superfamily enzyme